MQLAASAQWELRADEGSGEVLYSDQVGGEGGWPASEAHSGYPRLLGLPVSLVSHFAGLSNPGGSE